jgi:hypothetical protein
MSGEQLDFEEGLRKELAALYGRIFIEVQHRDNRTGEVRTVVMIDVDAEDTIDVIMRGESGGEEITTFSFTEYNQKRLQMERTAREIRDRHFEEVARNLGDELRNQDEVRALEAQYAEDEKYFDELPLEQQIEIIQEDLDSLFEREYSGFFGRIRKFCFKPK